MLVGLAYKSLLVYRIVSLQPGYPPFYGISVADHYTSCAAEAVLTIGTIKLFQVKKTRRSLQWLPGQDDNATSKAMPNK